MRFSAKKRSTLRHASAAAVRKGIDPKSQIKHHKYVLRDGTTPRAALLMGSANFTVDAWAHLNAELKGNVQGFSTLLIDMEDMNDRVLTSPFQPGIGVVTAPGGNDDGRPGCLQGGHQDAGRPVIVRLVGGGLRSVGSRPGPYEAGRADARPQGTGGRQHWS